MHPDLCLSKPCLQSPMARMSSMQILFVFALLYGVFSCGAAIAQITNCDRDVPGTRSGPSPLSGSEERSIFPLELFLDHPAASRTKGNRHIIRVFLSENFPNCQRNDRCELTISEVKTGRTLVRIVPVKAAAFAENLCISISPPGPPRREHFAIPAGRKCPRTTFMTGFSIESEYIYGGIDVYEHWRPYKKAEWEFCEVHDFIDVATPIDPKSPDLVKSLVENNFYVSGAQISINFSTKQKFFDAFTVYDSEEK